MNDQKPQQVPAPAITPTHLAETIGPAVALPDITAAIDAKLQSNAKNWPVRSIRASSIAHPCERFLVYEQTEWAKRRLPDLGLLYAFEEGKLHGPAVVRALQDAFQGTGITVNQSEAPIPDNKYGIGGAIDCVLNIPIPGQSEHRGAKVPVEIKSMAPWTWEAIETLEDMTQSPKPYLRQYPGQIMTYIHFEKSSEWGILLLKNKATGRYKQINVHYDLGYMDWLLDRAERITRYRQQYREATDDAGREAALPARVEYTQDICSGCPWRDLCLPDLRAVPGIEDRLSDTELDEACQTRHDNQQARDLWEDADKRAKAHVKQACGDLAPGSERTFLTRRFQLTAKKSAAGVRTTIEPFGD